MTMSPLRRQRGGSSRIPLLMLIITLFIGLSGLLPLLLHVRLDSQHGDASSPLRFAAVDVAVGGKNNSTERAHDDKRTPAEVPIVAYAVTITKCGKMKALNSPWTADSTIFDSAAVFQHSVRLVSYPRNPSARYGAKFYAFVVKANVHRDAPCVKIVENLGFQINYVDVPVLDALNHIVREYPNVPNRRPRRRIHDDGCCGEAEYIKLRMFELVKHPVVVHLDLDTILLQPLDELFDVIVHPPDTPRGKTARDHIISQKLIAPTYEGGVENVNAFYTKDWTSTWPGRGKVGVQGGFFVARPSLQVFEELTGIIRKGHYVQGRCKSCGWGGLGYGGQIEGSMTFQGIMAYYYDVISNAGVEVHMCKFNMMASNPRRVSNTKYAQATPLDSIAAGYQDKECRDGRNDCEDVQCQTWPMSDVRSLHYNFCLKPWLCPEPKINTKVEGTCRAMHREWFKVRRQLEGKRKVDGTYLPDTFLSYCRNTTAGGYIPMQFNKKL